MQINSFVFIYPLLQRFASGFVAVPSHSPQIIALPSRVDIASLHNLTNSNVLHSLPADPALFKVPESTQSILFGRYSRTLPQQDVLSCLLQAANLVIKHFRTEKDGLLGTDEIQTNSGVAHFFLMPSEKMTWSMVRLPAMNQFDPHMRLLA